MAKMFKAPKVKLPKTKFKFPSKKFWLSKKFLISIGLVVVLAIGGFLMWSGMKKNTIYKIAMDNIAEARYFMKSAQAGGLDVQFYAGVREEQYKQDGKATKPVAFALINIDTDSSFKNFDKIDGTIKINNDQYPISLLQNQYNALNFAYDIVGILNRQVQPEDTVEITLFITDTNRPTLTLANTFENGAINWNEALRVATNKIGNKVKNQQFETYVTILYNEALDSGAQWYVRFVTDKGNSYFCVVAADGSAIG